MPFVLAASVTLAWCFENEATPQTDGILDQAEREGVPLATADARLRAAARAVGVPLLPA